MADLLNANALGGAQLYQMLAGLGDSFTDAQDKARKRQIEDSQLAVYKRLGDPSANLSDLGRGLMAVGKVQEGASLMALAQKDQERLREDQWFRSNTGMPGPRADATGAGPIAQPTANASLLPAIAQAEANHGTPVGYLARIAQIESRGNPNAQNPNSSAGGAFQFIDSTARQYGLSNRFDPGQSADAAARLTNDNATVLRQALGREPTQGELYLAHQQGAGGAAKLLANPDARAIDLVGADAVRLNGGSPNMTAGQFASKWVSRLPGAQIAQAQQPAVASDAPAPGAQPAQAGFVIPGATPEQTQTIANDPDVKLWADRYGTAPSERAQRFAKTKLDLAIEAAKEKASNAKRFRPLTDPAERAQFGIPADDKRPYQIGPNGQIASVGGAQTTVNIDQKGETKFSEALGAAQAKRWNDYIAEGDVAQGRLADIATLRDTSRRLGSQGSAANLKATIGPYAESLGIKVDGLSDIQLYESIVNRLAPNLRAPGSGSTSDIEFKGFLRAIGPLSNTPEAREMILDTFEAASRNDMARSEIASRLASGEIQRGQAEKELRALSNPMEAFRAYRKANPDQVMQAVKEGVKNRDNVNAAPEAPKATQAKPKPVTTADDYNALPSGAQYLDPQGNVRTKR